MLTTLLQEFHPPEKRTTIIDLAPLSVAPKSVPPPEQQLRNESLQLWGGVTEAILAKQYSRATALKQQLEEQQREKARDRNRKSEVWKPVFFEQATETGGKPRLSEKGMEVLRRAQKGEWSMDGIVEKSSPNAQRRI
jgi:hypothetical protein